MQHCFKNNSYKQLSYIINDHIIIFGSRFLDLHAMSLLRLSHLHGKKINNAGIATKDGEYKKKDEKTLKCNRNTLANKQVTCQA